MVFSAQRRDLATAARADTVAAAGLAEYGFRQKASR